MVPEEDPQQLAQRYQMRSLRDLMRDALSYEGLVEPAKIAIREEFRRRGLEMPVPWQSSNFGEMSSRKLLQAARDYNRLSEAQQASLRAEFASRGMEPPVVEDEDQNTDTDSSSGNGEGVIDYVTVARYRDMPEAVVARSVLESAGIDCILRDENTIRMQWFLSNAMGGMRLQVAPADEAAARELLSQPMPASFPVDSGPDYEQPVCPNCGSIDVMANDTDRKILAPASAFFGGLFVLAAVPALALVPSGVWKCNHCGCLWIDDGRAEPLDHEPLG